MLVAAYTLLPQENSFLRKTYESVQPPLLSMHLPCELKVSTNLYTVESGQVMTTLECLLCHGTHPQTDLSLKAVKLLLSPLSWTLSSDRVLPPRTMVVD